MEDRAWRLSLFGEDVEGMWEIDPLTGDKLATIEEFVLYPNSHYVTPRPTLLQAIPQIKLELKERIEELTAEGKLLEAQRLQERTTFDIEMMETTGHCAGIENYSRYLTGRAPGEPPPTLFEYLPENALVIVDESHVMVPQLRAMYNGDRARKTTLVEHGFRLPSAVDNRPLRFEEWLAKTGQVVFLSATPSDYELGHSSQIVEQIVRPTGLVDPEVEVRPVADQVDDLLSEINKRTAMGDRVLVTTLTKRMAENLTDYLADHGVRVRYLHSDIDTVERVEIIRDLRLGEFDVLVGINLLREGLDMPEVSLVAILDADREGYLRSESSLIQTIGRAARNAKGKAILYADRITGSMKRAMDTTEARRAKQMAYNAEHGITPQTVKKNITDVMEGAYGHGRSKPAEYAKVAEEAMEYAALSPAQLMQRISQLEKKMYQHAQDLEFEEAARVRDEISHIRETVLGVPEAKAV